MRSITVDFTKGYIGTVAKQGEHNETRLVFTLPSNFIDADYVNVEFEKKEDGSKCIVENLEPENGTLSVLLTQDATSCSGTIGIQLVAYQVNGDTVNVIAKSRIIKASVDKSIEATNPAGTEASFIERLQAWLSDARDKLAELWEKRHTHSNKATIDELHSAALETPEPEVTVGGMADPYREQLAFRGQYLRMINDGGVIQGAEEVTVSGRKYLRLKIFYDSAVETYDIIEIGQNARPRFIDIPIASAQDSTIVDGGVTLNGTEISLGLDSVEQEIIGIQEDVAANTAASHTHDNLDALDGVTAQALTDIASNTAARHSHSNKSIIDQLSFVGNGGSPNLTYYDHFVNAYHIKNENDGYSGYLNPNTYTRIGYPYTVTSFTITSLYNGFQNAGAGLANEYIVAFRTGATAPTVTFPSSVIFQQELKLEPNKFYEISIVENVALWCAVDVEEEEP